MEYTTEITEIETGVFLISLLIMDGEDEILGGETTVLCDTIGEATEYAEGTFTNDIKRNVRIVRKIEDVENNVAVLRKVSLDNTASIAVSVMPEKELVIVKREKPVDIGPVDIDPWGPGREEPPVEEPIDPEKPVEDPEKPTEDPEKPIEKPIPEEPVEGEGA